MKVSTYWVKHPSGATYESQFTRVQVESLGAVWPYTEEGDEYKGIAFMMAARLIERWNKEGNKNGYYYYLHKPEV